MRRLRSNFSQNGDEVVDSLSCISNLPLPFGKAFDFPLAKWVRGHEVEQLGSYP